MANWNRRRFLALTASAGVSAYVNIAEWNASRRYRVAIIGWDSRSRDIAAMFAQMKHLDVVALAGLPPDARHRESLSRVFPNRRPPLYPNSEAMLQDHTVDFLYKAEAWKVAHEHTAHLLIEDADPEDLKQEEGNGRYIQALPRYEFSGLSRSTAELSGNWTRAVIDCHVALPDDDFANRAELSTWLYRQVGDALDFACEMTEFGVPSDIFGIAAPADSPYAARFGWRILGKNGRAIDLSVYASQAFGQLANRTKILLRGAAQAVSLSAAARSLRLSRLATLNLMHAIGAADPGLLSYGLAAFTPARELVKKAVSVL